MLKLIFAGDPHIRGANPRNRTDDYRQAVKDKLNYIKDLAASKQVDAVVFPGDIFDSPKVSVGVLLEFKAVLEAFTVPIYTTAGNHDIHGYNLQSFERSSLKLLEMLVPQLRVINSPDNPVVFMETADRPVQITFTPYNGKMDKDGYGYNPGATMKHPEAFKIHVAHGMLLDHDPPFEGYTKIEDVETEADLVLTGHEHHGYGVVVRDDGVNFCNPGSLTRLSASKSEIKRVPKVAYIEITDRINCIDLLSINIAKPGEEVLDRSKIEEAEERRYSMEKFSALMETEEEDAIVDVNQIVEEIGKKETYAPEVVELALKKIDEQREELE